MFQTSLNPLNIEKLAKILAQIQDFLMKSDFDIIGLAHFPTLTTQKVMI